LTSVLDGGEWLDIDQIPTEMIQVGGNTLRSQIHNLINSIWNKEQLPQQWKESINVFMKRVIKLTVLITDYYHS
jgi:hypothetical protein